MNNKIIKLLMAAVSLAVSSSVLATSEGVYVGGQFGQSTLNNSSKQVQTGLADPATQLTQPSNSGFGGRIYIGYQFNQYGGFETGYTYFSPSTYNPATSILAGKGTINAAAVDLLGKAQYPISKVDIFVKGGIAAIGQKQSGRLYPITGNTQGRFLVVRPKVAVGVSYDVTPNWVADVEASQILKFGTSVPAATLYALGISYHWVDLYCGQFLC